MPEERAINGCCIFPLPLPGGHGTLPAGGVQASATSVPGSTSEAGRVRSGVKTEQLLIPLQTPHPRKPLHPECLPIQGESKDRASRGAWENAVNETARASRSCPPIVLCLATVLCLVIGCGEVPPTEPPHPVATTVIMSPAAATLTALGDTTRITATLFDQNGQAMAAALVNYSSSASGVVTVDGSGLVTAVGNGTAAVTATSGEASGSATVTVEQRVTEVRVSPDSVTLFAIGDTVRLAVGALDANGHHVANVEFAWSSADSVATVDGSGLVTAVVMGPRRRRPQAVRRPGARRLRSSRGWRRCGCRPTR